MQNDEKRIAVFIDFENVAMGVKESNYGNFDIELVLKRVVEKGKILVKRAYSDWHRYAEFKRVFHQAAIELIDVPQTRYSGKNSADIRMVVDALDLSYQKEHIDTFVLVSGDSDFSPLVSKLRENGRYVIGVGVKQSSSDLLVNNCDEFIYYEDLFRPTSSGTGEESKLTHLPQKRAEAIRLVMETFQALQREGKEVIYGSMVKQTLLRKLPSFNESYYGYPMFSRLLEEAAENKLLRLTKDVKSGGYILTGTSEASTGQSVSVSPTNGDSPEEAPATIESTVTKATSSPGSPSADAREWGRRSRWGRGRRPQRFGEHTRSQHESSKSIQQPAEIVSDAVRVGPLGETNPMEVAAEPEQLPQAPSMQPGPPTEVGAGVATAAESNPAEMSKANTIPESKSKGSSRRPWWQRGRKPFGQRRGQLDQAASGETSPGAQDTSPETPVMTEPVEAGTSAASSTHVQPEKPQRPARGIQHRTKHREEDRDVGTSVQSEVAGASGKESVHTVESIVAEPPRAESRPAPKKTRPSGSRGRGKTPQPRHTPPKKTGKK